MCRRNCAKAILMTSKMDVMKHVAGKTTNWLYAQLLQHIPRMVSLKCRILNGLQKWAAWEENGGGSVRSEILTLVVVLIGETRLGWSTEWGRQEGIRKPLFPFVAITSKMISLGNFLEKSSQLRQGSTGMALSLLQKPEKHVHTEEGCPTISCSPQPRHARE
jgi:hypothetical protein